MSTIFSKIISGEIPCYKVAEDDNCLAFLDINPVAKGHTLVIPKKEVDYFFELIDEDYTHLMLFAKKVAKAIEKVIPCPKVGVTVLGLEVRHAHVHLVPLDHTGLIDFKKKTSFSPEVMTALAQEISSNL